MHPGLQLFAGVNVVLPGDGQHHSKELILTAWELPTHSLQINLFKQD